MKNAQNSNEKTIPGHNEQNLALVHWYKFKYNDSQRLFKYDCPHMKSVPMFTIIAIDSIIGPVHIIPRFNKPNEYFINLSMF
nr:2857_t:CDS:2 [Entrophospora candida]